MTQRPALHEHAHRYGIALGMAAGRRVLDVECGDGTGLAWLAGAGGATIAVGSHPDAVAVKSAADHHAASGACFVVADGHALPHADGSFDLVTCFDGLELSDDPSALVAELDRVTAADGVLLVSLATNSSGPGVDELEAMVRARFRSVLVLGQRVATSSVVWPLAPSRDTTVTTLAGEPPEAGHVRLEPTSVLLACARATRAPELGTSTYIDPRPDVVAPATPAAGPARRLQTFEDELAEAISARLAAEERAARQLRVASSARAAAEERAARLLRDVEVSDRARRAVEAELAVERGSIAGQVLRGYRTSVGRALPSGTRRREAYERTRSSVGKVAQRALVNLPNPRELPRQTSAALAPMTSPPLARAIRFAEEPDPLVSIVIRVHGHADIALRCLARIATTTTSVPYEVVVVDDASDPDTAASLAEVVNLRIVTNPVEEGYLASVNRGVAATSTELVVLLNHDTEVHPGWLDALVDTVRGDDSVGAVGARLVDVHGRLSEAGRIIFDDASYAPYGAGANPNSYRYLWSRSVDFCSAACLLVRRSLWDRLGGFDPVYRPAYYGDADLCFGIRSLGSSVVYQPRAMVTHHEGHVTGADEVVIEGMRRHQARNQSIFADRWRESLAGQAPPGQAFRGRRHRAGPTVVVVDHHVPAPDHDSGSVRMDHLLQLLVAAGRHVCFIPQDARLHPEHVARLQQLGIEVAAPCLDLDDLLHDLAGETELVVLSRPEVAAEYQPLVRRHMPRAVIAYDTVDLHDLRSRRRVAVEGRADRHDQHLVELERRLSRSSDIVIAVSDPEAIALNAIAPGTPVVRISNVHDDHFIDEPFDRRSGFLFVGNFQHPPNVDAVVHLLGSVWPAIRGRLPDASLHLVGAGMHPAAVAAAVAPGGIPAGVVVHGWLPDLEPVLGRSRVFLAPLRYGAGVKGKIGQALASGIPVVTTSIGAEGMVGRHLVVADDPGALVDAAVALHEDPSRWIGQVVAGRAFVEEALGPDAAARSVDALLAEVARIRDERGG